MFPEAASPASISMRSSGAGGPPRSRSVPRRRTDFLLGTQMVTKAFHFPGVTLVGSSSPISSSTSPTSGPRADVFRSLTQVAGRAGRGRAPVRSSCSRTTRITRRSGAPPPKDYAPSSASSGRAAKLEYLPTAPRRGRNPGEGEERVIAGSARSSACSRGPPPGWGFRSWGRLPSRFPASKGWSGGHFLLRSKSRRQSGPSGSWASAVAGSALPGVHVGSDVDPRAAPINQYIHLLVGDPPASGDALGLTCPVPPIQIGPFA